MKTRLLSLALAVVLLSDCKKDSQSHNINDQLKGTWTQVSGAVDSYDIQGKLLSTVTARFADVKFNGHSTMYASQVDNLTMGQSYTLSTSGDTTFVTTRGTIFGNHKYAIKIITDHQLVLAEKQTFPAGAEVASWVETDSYTK